MSREISLLYVPDREQWRAWLEANHETATEIWLVNYKKHTGAPSVPYDDAVEEALCFGWIDSTARKVDDDRFAQRYTPRKNLHNWSEPNLRRMEKMIAAGRMTPAGLARFQPEPQEPRFESGSPLPPWVESALRENEAAWSFFETLAPSYRREYVRWITEAKKEETRQRRLAEALRLLEQNRKPGTK